MPTAAVLAAAEPGAGEDAYGEEVEVSACDPPLEDEGASVAVSKCLPDDRNSAALSNASAASFTEKLSEELQELHRKALPRFSVWQTGHSMGTTKIIVQFSPKKQGSSGQKH